MKRTLTVVTPIFNEEQNVEELCERIAAAMSRLPYDYEHLCIDNASTDQTVAHLRRRAAQDPHVKVIINARNFGYIRSSFHGLLQATGDAVILIASDLQDPPEKIAEFVAEWERGFKTVLAVKASSEESKVMYSLRRLYYFCIGQLSDVALVPNATGSGLFDREVIGILRTLRDPYPYFRGLVCEIGFPIATVAFNQPKRLRGVTSQNWYVLYDMAMLAVVKHSKVPLRMLTLAGFMLAGLSATVACGYLVAKIVSWDSFKIGFAPLLIGLFFFAAIQMIFLGLLGEYVGSIHTHIRRFPHVIEAERINFTPASGGTQGANYLEKALS